MKSSLKMFTGCGILDLSSFIMAQKSKEPSITTVWETRIIIIINKKIIIAKS